MSSGKEGCNFWLISGWFVRYLADLWVVWLVCGWFVGGLAGCGWFGWFVGGFEFYGKQFFLKANINSDTVLFQRTKRLFFLR